MRIGFLADVHANTDALAAVFRHAEENDPVDRWWCLGDVVGRGPEPVETLLLLQQHVRTRHWLPGNHDAYVVDRIQSPDGETQDGDRWIWDEHRERLRHTLDGRGRSLWAWCRKTWSLERARPHLLRAGDADCWIVHAALGDAMCNIGETPGCYTLPWITAEKRVIAREQFRRLAAQPGNAWTRVLIFGHTHLPYMAVWPALRDDYITYPIRYDRPEPLTRWKLVLLNPGSVGQPRNGDPMVHASYGVLDTDACTFQFCRAPYDSERIRLAMAALHYDPYLIHMLRANDEYNPIGRTNALWQQWHDTYRSRPWGWEPMPLEGGGQ